MILTFEKETPDRKEKGKIIGIDIGVKKLITTSENREHGKEIEKLMQKIQRKQQGSQAFQRALKERDYYVNRIFKELPFEKLKCLFVEAIKNIKRDTAKEKIKEIIQNKIPKMDLLSITQKNKTDR